MYKKMIYLISFVLVLGLATGVESADPFEQDPGPDGIVSIEAENIDDNISRPPSTWELGQFLKDRNTLCLDSRLRHGRKFRFLPCRS